MPVWDADTASGDLHISSPHGFSLSSRICSNESGTWRTSFFLHGMDTWRVVPWRTSGVQRTPGRAPLEHGADRGNTSGSSPQRSYPLVLFEDARQTSMIPFSSEPKLTNYFSLQTWTTGLAPSANHSRTYSRLLVRSYATAPILYLRWAPVPIRFCSMPAGLRYRFFSMLNEA